MKNLFIFFIATFIVLLFIERWGIAATTSTPPTVTTPNTVIINNAPDGGTTRQSTTYSTTKTTTTTVNDDKIVSLIYDRYGKDPALIYTNLTVTSENGVVTISGTVTAQSQADEAVIAAKKVPGVNDVRSDINVLSNPNANRPLTIPPHY